MEDPAAPAVSGASAPVMSLDKLAHHEASSSLASPTSLPRAKAPRAGFCARLELGVLTQASLINASAWHLIILFGEWGRLSAAIVEGRAGAYLRHLLMASGARGGSASG